MPTKPVILSTFISSACLMFSLCRAVAKALQTPQLRRTVTIALPFCNCHQTSFIISVPPKYKSGCSPRTKQLPITDGVFHASELRKKFDFLLPKHSNHFEISKCINCMLSTKTFQRHNVLWHLQRACWTQLPSNWSRREPSDNWCRREPSDN